MRRSGSHAVLPDAQAGPSKVSPSWSCNAGCRVPHGILPISHAIHSAYRLKAIPCSSQQCCKCMNMLTETAMNTNAMQLLYGQGWCKS